MRRHVSPRYLCALFFLTLAAVSCQSPGHDSAPIGGTAASPAADSSFASVPDSAWISIRGVTLIAFYPIRTNEELERDEDLATVLDDFSYHLGTAMDSLTAAGVSVHMHGGDTVWLRSDSGHWRWIRPMDSADVGYLLSDDRRRTAILYGVRTTDELIESVKEFGQLGTVAPR